MLLLAAACFVCHSASAGPLVVTFNFTATVWESTVPEAAYGDLMTGTLTYQIPADASGYSGDGINYNDEIYVYALGEATLTATDTVTNQTFSGGTGSACACENSVYVDQGLPTPEGFVDEFQYQTTATDLPPDFRGQSSQALLALAGTGPGSVLTSDALPASLYSNGWASGFIFFGGGSLIVNADITSLSEVGTPEPRTFLLCAGLLLAFLGLWRSAHRA